MNTPYLQPVCYRVAPLSGMAVAGFVISLVALLAAPFGGGLLSPVGIVCSAIGLADTAAMKGRRGKALAGWGLGLGLVGLAPLFLIAIPILAAVGAAGS